MSQPVAADYAFNIANSMSKYGFTPIACKDKRPLLNAWNELTNKTWKDKQGIKIDGKTRKAYNLGYFKDQTQCGIITGKASGVIVVDIDKRKEHEDPNQIKCGLETWNELVEKFNYNIDTPYVETPSGGLHLYYRYDRLTCQLSTSAKRLKDNSGRSIGIDIRGDRNGQVIAPGSIHQQSGKVYQWSKSPDEVPIQPMPEFLYLFLKGEQPTIKLNECLDNGKVNQAMDLFKNTYSKADLYTFRKYTDNAIYLTRKEPISLCPVCFRSHGDDKARGDNAVIYIRGRLQKVYFYCHGNELLLGQLNEEDPTESLIFQGERGLALLYSHLVGENEKFLDISPSSRGFLYYDEREALWKRELNGVLSKRVADRLIPEIQKTIPKLNRQLKLFKEGKILSPEYKPSIPSFPEKSERLKDLEAFDPRYHHSDEMTEDWNQFFESEKKRDSKALESDGLYQFEIVKYRQWLAKNQDAQALVKGCEVEKQKLMKYYSQAVKDWIAEVDDGEYRDYQDCLNWDPLTSPEIAYLFKQYMKDVVEADYQSMPSHLRKYYFCSLFYARYHSAIQVWIKSQDFESKIQNKIKSLNGVIGSLNKTTFQNNVAAQIRLQLLDPSFEEKLNNIPHLFPVLNKKVVDLQTGQLIDRTKEHYFTYESQVAYDPEADSSVFNSFVDDILDSNQEHVDILKRFLATGLIGEAPRLTAIFIGDERNGKSTLLNLYEHILGNAHVRAPNEVFLSQGKGDQSRNPALISVKKARAVSSSEFEARQKLNGMMIKRISGGDSMNARDNYDRGSEMKPFTVKATLMLMTNRMPEIDFGDQATDDRMLIMKFPCRYLTAKELESEKEKSKGRIIKPIDLHLFDKLMKPENLSGCLKELVKYAQKFFTDGLTPDMIPIGCQEEKDRFRGMDDALEGFMESTFSDSEDAEQWVQRDEKLRQSKSEFYKVYCQYLDEHGINERPSIRIFGQELHSRYGHWFKDSKSGSVRCYVGIKAGKMCREHSNFVSECQECKKFSF